MEEKKTITIRLSTIILIIAVIVIIIMAVYIYNEKINSNKTQNTADNLQEKVENTLGTNENIDDSQVENISNTEEFSFSEDEIKLALQEYLELVGINEGSPSALLQKLNLINISDITYTDDYATSDGYIKTNIQYSEYKNAMMNYMTEECFNIHFTNGFKDEDGVLCYFNGGATGMEFEVESINLKGDYSNANYIANVYNVALDGTKEAENIEFHIANYNGKCVISYCD